MKEFCRKYISISFRKVLCKMSSWYVHDMCKCQYTGEEESNFSNVWEQQKKAF